MTSPYRFDGTGEPETEEERRKRQLREAMRAAQLGLPLASQLPAMTITAPRPAAFDASARRTADIVSAFESALESQRRLPEALKAAEAGIPLASRTQAPLPPVVITPENRYQAHPWTLAMNRAQMEQEEAAKLPELPRQLTMRDIAKDVAVQPLAAASGLYTRFSEAGARVAGNERFAEKMVRQREAVNQATQPTTSFGTGARVLSELGIGAAPYMALGTGLKGVAASAGLTGLESQSEAGSMVQGLADITDSETLKRLAANRAARTATDVGVDLAANLLLGGVRPVLDDISRIRQVSRRAPQVAEQAAETAARVPARLEATPMTIGEFAARPQIAPPTQQLALPAPRPQLALPVPRPQVTEQVAEAASQLHAPIAFPDKLFSRLERAITAAPFEKGTPQQWQAAISKGVAAGEREWVGIDDFLKNSQSPTLTKADVLGQFEQGKIRLGENVYDYSVVAERDAIKERQTKTQNAINELKDTLVKQTPEWKAMQQADDEYVRLVKESQNALQKVEVVTNEAIREAKDAIKKEGNFGFDSARDAWNEILFSHFDDTFKGATTPSWESQFDAATLKPETTLTVNRALATYDAYRKAGEPFIAPVGAARVRSENAKRAVDEAVNRIMVESPEVQRLNAEMSVINEELRQNIKTQPRWGSITQPGTKDNYREVVLTLDGQDATDTYRSSHWEEKNPLVHVRMTDRALPSGEKALFVEEIQSDWHQAGRKRGYKTPDTTNEQLEELKALRAQALADGNEREAGFLAEQIQDIRDEMRELSKAVPQAPFKKTQDWAELGLKRVVQEAVDKGYDRVVMVRGDQAADRIAQQIQEVKTLNWATTDDGKTFALLNVPGGRREVREIAKGVPANQLSKYVGDDVANRIIAGSAEAAEGTIDGIDLKVGGEGMKAFYDKIVPNTLRDLGKSMGLKIELEPVKLFTDGDNLSFRITPEVRQKVQTEGMRLYDVTGAVPEALRYAMRPAVAPVVGAAVGATQSEDNRLAGAIVGATAGAGAVAGLRGAKLVLRAARDLRANGLPESAAQALVLAQRGIDYSGKGAERVFRLAKGNIVERLKKGVEAAIDPVRIIEKVGLTAEKAGKAPETSVATALNEALSSDVTAMRAIAHGSGVERGGIISPVTREIISEPLEDVFKPLGGNPVKNTQATTYALALRFLGRYDEAAAKARQWDTLAADAAREAEQNLPNRPAAGVDDPALAERLRAEGERMATEALGPRPNPLQVYGGDQARLEADRQIVAVLGKKPEYVEFAKRLEGYFDALTRYAVESGLWTPEFAATIRNSDAFYIPVKRLREVAGAKGGPMTGRVTPGRVGPGVQRFTGSNLMIGNPVETIANYTQALIRRADMYRVGNALIEDALFTNSPLITRITSMDPRARSGAVAEVESAYRQLGLSEDEAQKMSDLFMRFDPENPVIWRNGPDGKEFYLLNDPWVYTGIRSINPQDPAAFRAILTVLGPLKRLATSAATGSNPAFWLATNVPRDVLTAAGNVPGLSVQDAATGIAESIRYLAARSGRAEELGRFGAGTVSMYGPESPSIAAQARRIAPTGETPLKAWGGRIGQEMVSTAGMPLRAVERVGRATEVPMRIAAAERAAADAAARGLSERAQNALAARAFASATVDFRRKSAYALDRLLEGSIPFYGAAKRGALWTARAVKNNPKTAMALASIVTLGTVWEYLLSDDKDRQEFVDRPASQRARYIHLGPTRFALPQEYAAIAAATRLGLAQIKDDDPFAFEQFKEAMMNILPPGASDVARGGAVGLLPFPLIQGALEIQQNRSIYTGQPIVPQSMERLSPEARRRETTAPTFDVMARAGRAMGLEQFSPLQAEYLTRDLLGGFTDMATAISDVAAAPLAKREAAGKVPLPFLRQPLNPLAGYTTRPVTRGQSEEAFYESRNAFQQAEATLLDMSKRAEKAEAQQNTQALQALGTELQQIQQTNPLIAQILQPGVLEAYKTAFDATDEQLKTLRDQRQFIVSEFANKRMTSARARAAIDSLDVQRARTLREVYGLLRQAMPQ